MQFTDLFIKKPVFAVVVSLFIVVFGLRSVNQMPVQQYPKLESALITITTNFVGADPETISSFITTPIETAVAQSTGIDYMTSTSAQNGSIILVNLLLNWNIAKALSEVNTRVNSVINQLPANAQQPKLKLTVAETIASMYITFYSDILQTNQINDYVLRTVQPRIQAVNGVQEASIIGDYQFALRAWLQPDKLAAYNLTPAEVATVLQRNDFVAATGRSDGNVFVANLTSNSSMTTVKEFENLIVKSQDGANIRLKDIAKVKLGSQNYNTDSMINMRKAIYLAVIVAPDANLLSVVKQVRQVYSQLHKDLPKGLEGTIVYDASKFVERSIEEVVRTLFEAFLIVTFVVFLFLGSFRALIIPTIAIPLSIIGTFFIMYILGYSINLLTLLALVLAIGLVVDDAIIVVENVQRHIVEGKSTFEAAIISARELVQPIIAMTVVLIAVYIPIGFMTGITGALFTEFAFTLAAAVTVSGVVALTLSPMMCAKMLLPADSEKPRRMEQWVEHTLEKMTSAYKRLLQTFMRYMPVVIVFAIVILVSNYFLFITSKSELSPQEDQGVIMSFVMANANSSLAQTSHFTKQVSTIFHEYPETINSFEIVGVGQQNSPPALNNAFAGMVLKPWEQRTRTAEELQRELQVKLNDNVPGAQVAAFQPPPLPGGGSGLPVQFIIEAPDTFIALNKVAAEVLEKAMATGKFIYLDKDLKIDKQQTKIMFDRDRIAEFGLTMREVGDSVSASLSENYVNYFNYMGRSYQVIPQMEHSARLETSDLLDYYIKTSNGQTVSLDTLASLKNEVVPQNINHFQQLNSAMIQAVPMPFVSLGEALQTLREIAKPILPEGYAINYAGQSRQFMQESEALIVTFFFALIIIYLSLALLFNSFRDPVIVLVTVPMSVCGAMMFITVGLGGATLNIYTQVGLVTLIGLISKHGILIVKFANDLQEKGVAKLEAVIEGAAIRFRPILMTTGAMVLGVTPLLLASGAGAVSRFAIGLVIAAGISIGTLFTLFVVPAMYILFAHDLQR